jgi:predicted RNA-binding Zn ribbon-like protein
VAFYPSLGLPLPLELANTHFANAGRRVDGLASRADLDAWLHHNAHGFDQPPPAATPPLLERFRALRDTLERLLVASLEDSSPAPADVEFLNELSARAPRYASLELVESDYHLRVVDLAEPDVATLASVARACIELLAGPLRARLRRCGAPGCVLFFLKDRRRREWCSDACGNRARVARHYVRHRRSPTARRAQAAAAGVRPPPPRSTSQAS